MFGKYPRRFPGLPGVPGVSPGSCYMKTNLFIHSFLENKNTIKKIQFQSVRELFFEQFLLSQKTERHTEFQLVV